MQLTSTKNRVLQNIRYATAHGRPLDDGRIVIEGPHLLEEAVRSRWTIEQVFATPESGHRHGELLARVEAELTEVPSRVFASIASTETTQQLLALVRPNAGTWEEIFGGPQLAIVLDGIQDPGNAGTIVRSAEAFGAGGIVFLEGCVHVANGKFLRATAGSIFRLPYLEGVKRDDFILKWRSTPMRLYALTAGGSTLLTEAKFAAPCILVAGSEAGGISPAILTAAQSIRIPTQQVESLNTGVACSLALFEAARQRGFK
jgi:TrmH family RNA methyltransferase